VFDLTRDEVTKVGVSVVTHVVEASPIVQEDRVQLQQVILKLIARSSMADRRRGGTQASTAPLGEDTLRYRMHVQMEFPIPSAASDLWVYWAGQAHAAALAIKTSGLQLR
jgi:hypothetical protein